MVPIGQIWGAGKEAPLSQHNLIGEGMELAPPGSPYIAPHVLSRSQKLCIAKDHTCKGFRSAGTNYCAGHQRSLGLLKPKVKEEPVDGDAAGTS